MDATITYDEVAALSGVNIPSLEPRPNFKRIQNLQGHFEHALQHLPYPQTLQQGWKGMVMARELYALHKAKLFRLLNDPSKALTYVCVIVVGKPINKAPLT
jgi:hypothetical protein